ncbi:MAG TPA: T9SS type A sorting domain-containing protein, partial [Paludibacter sp.]
DFHSYEVLAQKPTSLAIANNEVTWTAEGVSWDVEVRSSANNSLLRSGTVTNKSFSLADLSSGFVVKIRTLNNGVYSDWATYNYLTAVSSPELSKVTISSFNDRITVTNGASATLSIYDIEGRSIAEFKLSLDIENIDASFLRKGLYICQIRKENFSVTSKLIK